MDGLSDEVLIRTASINGCIQTIMNRISDINEELSHIRGINILLADRELEYNQEVKKMNESE